MIEYAEAPEKPSTLARSLAKRGYSPDTIEAAIINEFGYRISRGFLNDLCRHEANRKHYRHIEPAPGVMQADAKYRETMAEANSVFVNALYRERVA